ncbi:hypothetical protein [Candidatus Finniella inopinata]|uniref:Uncharacterized protein n=1 Tax=Candidatus Finniella inopinata TaxID=1696036 RepID=A0A4Q7DH99_9PROT|nr:hypothetical protein [Candidatus Finniella inopinata]RZI46082.1 hypothetical protein EQU50_03885 [Candidatus Finniella inopinata]
MYVVSKMLLLFTGIGCIIAPDHLQARVSLDRDDLYVDNLMPSPPAISSLLVRRGIMRTLAITPAAPPSSLLPEEARTPAVSMTPKEQATCTAMSISPSSDLKEEAG